MGPKVKVGSPTVVARGGHFLADRPSSGKMGFKLTAEPA